MPDSSCDSVGLADVRKEAVIGWWTGVMSLDGRDWLCHMI